MESLDFTDDELKAEHRRAHKLAILCDNAGRPEQRSHYRGVMAACEQEAESRGISL